MSAQYQRGWDECLEKICASQCDRCRLGAPIKRDAFGWVHPWARSGVELRCWASATRDAAAAKSKGAGNEAGAVGGG